jgi:asparagine synthase (glutamine-hydrolysing)
MCGITGKISFKDTKISSLSIEEMNETIKHRGPDATGVYVSPDQLVGLGHQRLAIIDLSDSGKQPMRYLDRYEIVFNGEIYNFQEKREELTQKGYAFTSESDTEVVLALYAEYGRDCVKHLRGMFAFAIYDEQDHTLFCARDRVGKKPFKYYRDENTFIFASELKAILTQPEYNREPDYEAIHHYLTLQYVPAPLTGFKDIYKLEPAHYMYIDLRTGETEKKQYWKLNYHTKWNLSKKAWQEKILEKLEESVKLRMISDVPLGAFLSGGIDSSAVVAMMSRHSTEPVKTFSIGFKEDAYNELPYARMIAKKFKTEHTEFIVAPDAIELLPNLVRQYEEPFADSSALPTYLVSKLTREHVTVALNGDGGDENFAGYGRYSVLKFSLFYTALIPFHNLLILPITRLTSQIFKTTFLDRAYRFAKTLSDDYRSRYVNYICYFTNEMKATLYTEAFKEKVGIKNSYDTITSKFTESGSTNKTEQAVYADFTTYLPGALMTKVDIASMAVALEGRSPFLDHELLELTAKIPFSLKLKGLNNKKYILKEALRGIILDEVMFRPKMGFGIPIHNWFRHELKEYAHNILLSDKALSRNLFKKESLEELLRQHSETQVDYGYHIWALITLELWFQEYFS